MTETNRQQRVVERILEDESLRGDLEDPVATALINWASERAGTIAADPARSDAAVDAASLAIRAAARQAASSGEREPERVVALAEAALAKQSPPNQDEVAGSTPRQPAAPAATGESRSDDAEIAARADIPQATAPDQNDAATPASPAARSVDSRKTTPPSKRRSKRRQRFRRKSK